MAGRLIHTDQRSKRAKPSKSKRLEAARVEHEKFLRGMKVSGDQISKRKMKPGYLDRMPDLKVESPVPLSNGFAPTPGKNTIMEKRYRERPEVRAEIERKAMRTGSTYNKGGHGYLSDGDIGTPRTRK